jgi:hypothetical protein
LPSDEERAVKFLFDNESMSFETLRIADFVAYGGAALGEAISIARHISEDDDAGWY